MTKFMKSLLFLSAAKVHSLNMEEINAAISFVGGFSSSSSSSSASNNNNAGDQPQGTRVIAQSDMANINDYGCWCYFEENHGQGKGTPIDDIDEICRVLHDGYTCIIMDSEEAGIPCIPWEIPYNSAVGNGIPALGMTEENIISECDVQNALNTCENWTCKVEGYFVRSLLLHFTHGGHSIEENYRHVNGFDKNSQCPVSNTNPQNEKECCGEYPKRSPFKPNGLNGTKACCNGKTYNSSLFLCCDNGEVDVSCDN